MQQLIASLFMQAFANPWLAEQEDQARLDLAQLTAQGDRLAFSTDSYVIDPLFSPAATSASWRYAAPLTTWRSAVPCRAISPADLFSKRGWRWLPERVVNSMARTAQAAEIAIVTGDTKVVRAARRINCLSIPPGSAPFRRIFAGGTTDRSRRRPAGQRHAGRPRRHHSQPPRTAGSGRRAGQRLCGADAAYSDAARCSRHQSATRCDPRRSERGGS